MVARVDSLGTPPAPTLDVALRRLPFVGVRTNSRGEAELTIRGSESRTPTVLFDGLPVTLGWDSRTDPSLIPLTGVSTIRISRGMNSVLAGPNAVGGIVELNAATSPLVTRGATLATGADQLGASVFSAGYASPFAISDGELALRIAGTLRDRPALARADGVDDPGARSGRRINSDSRESDLFVSARYATGPGAFVGASVAAYDAERGVQPELHIEEPRLWRYPEQRRTFANIAAGTGVRTTPFGAGSLDLSLGINDGTTRIETYEDRTYRNVNGSEDGAERTVMSRAVATHSFIRGGTLRVGASLANIRYDETLDTDPTTRYTQRLFSVGTEAEVPLTSQLSLAAGIALDNAENPETGGRDPLPARDAAAARIGLTANLGTTRLHAAASQRSRFPALRELYSGALGRFQPNPDLKPERLTVIEGGATVTRGALSVQGLAFYQRNEDGVVRTTLPDRRFFRVNRDEIRSQGLEGIATWTYGGTSLLADVLVQRVRVHDVTDDNAERRPEHVPEFRATLGVTVPVIAGLTANAWATQTGTQYCVHPDLGEQVRLGAQTRTDLGVDRVWKVTAGLFSQLRASLSLDNVTNAAVYDQCGMPQPGRTLRAGLSFR